MNRLFLSFLLFLMNSLCHSQTLPIGLRVTFCDDTPVVNIAFSTKPTISHCNGNLEMKTATLGNLTYSIDNIKKVEYMSPEVTFPVNAHSSPLNADVYYASFFSSLWSYEVPEGVTAYTGTVTGSRMRLSDIGSGIIPAGVAVILISDSPSYNLAMKDCASGLGENDLEGVDTETEQDAEQSYYVLSKGEDGDKKDIIGFYRLYSYLPLQANKAYYRMSSTFGLQSKSILFYDEIVQTSIDNQIKEPEDSRIFDLGGQYLKNPQKGINIIKGRKYLVKQP